MGVKNIILSWFIGVALAVMLISSCSSGGFAPTKQSFGGANEVIVIADEETWKGPVGDTLRFYLEAAYPVLPQYEPIYDLRHFDMKKIEENADRLRFRNIVCLANVADNSSATGQWLKGLLGEENILRMEESDEKYDVKNKWAVGQAALFFYAKNDQALIESVVARSSSIAKLFKEHGRKMLERRVYSSGKSEKIKKAIMDAYGIEMNVPTSYEIVLDDKEKHFMWLRKVSNRTHVHTNLMVHKIPYDDQSQLQPEKVKEIRNKLGKEYISSNVKNSYMRVNDIHLPMFHKKKTISGKYGLELKGIWEMSADTDSQGGAFQSCIVLNETKNELIYVDAFSYAPGEEKRDIMQGLDVILSSISIPE